MKTFLTRLGCWFWGHHWLNKDVLHQNFRLTRERICVNCHIEERIV